MKFSQTQIMQACVVACGTVAAAVMAACSSIDCPLNNRVYTTYCLMTPEKKADTLALALTISTNRTDGSDSVIINKNEKTTTFSLPISYQQPTDEFYVELALDTLGHTVVDTMRVSKENTMHFESTECAASYFHTITGVTTTHHAIDSVVINTKEVDYDTTKKHFYIYFKPRN